MLVFDLLFVHDMDMVRRLFILRTLRLVQSLRGGPRPRHLCPNRKLIQKLVCAFSGLKLRRAVLIKIRFLTYIYTSLSFLTF